MTKGGCPKGFEKKDYVIHEQPLISHIVTLEFEADFLPHSAPSLILSKVENLASTSFRDEATRRHKYDETTRHPPAAHIF